MDNVGTTFGQLFDNCWTIVDWRATYGQRVSDFQATAVRRLDNYWTTCGQRLNDCWATDVRNFDNYWTMVGQRVNDFVEHCCTTFGQLLGDFSRMEQHCNAVRAMVGRRLSKVRATVVS